MRGLVALILLLLKWLGILLLILIGVVLAAVVCILFVPVRYRVYIEKQEEFFVRGYASWLLHFLHFSFQVKKGKESHRTRILGIPLAKGSNSGGKRNRQQSHRKRGKKGGSNIRESSRETQEKCQNTAEDGRKGTQERAGEREGDRWNQSGRDEGGKWRPGRWFSRIREFFLRFCHILVKIKEGVCGLWKRLVEGTDQERDSMFTKVTTVLSDENTLQLWRLVWENLSVLWKHSRPRRLEGRIHFGTSDPCVTGQILGAAGVGYALTGGGIQIVPDFDNAVFEGYLEMRGRIRMIKLLFALGKVFFSSQWKYFRNQIG